MSRSISRRSFAAGGLVTIFGGSALPLVPVQYAVSQGTDLASLGLPEISINVTESAFDGAPTDLEAGRYLLNVTVSETAGFGVVGFVSPPDGMSREDFLAEVGDFPESYYGATFAGGVVAEAGSTYQAVLDLPPGEWILWGDDPFMPQAPVPFTVTGGMPQELPDPDADITMTLSDFAVALEGNVVSGDHVLRIVHQGNEPHWIELKQGADELTEEDFALDLANEMLEGATPEATPASLAVEPVPVVSVATLSAGAVMWVPVSLVPGTFYAACFVPTREDGLPHANHGMYMVFTVE